MGFLQRLWTFLGGSADDEGAARSEQRAGGSVLALEPTGARGVATLETDEDMADVPHEGWWTPDLQRVAAQTEKRGSTPLDQPLFDAIARRIDDPELELPRVPRVADQALLKLRESSVDYRELAQIVKQDAALTAQILRVANSVAYRGFHEIRNLDLAFARIGQRTLKSVILGTTMRSLAIRTGGPTRTLGEELWRASLASGVICGEIGRRMDQPEEEYFLAGLLHDIGMLGVLGVTHDFAQKHIGTKISRELFERLATQWHEHLGLRLADAWGLPDPLPELIGTHHRKPVADEPTALLRHTLTMADAMCSLLEFTPYRPIDLFGCESAAVVGIVNNSFTREWLAGLPNLIAERAEAF